MTEARIPIDHSVHPSLRPKAFPFQMLTHRVFGYATTVAPRSTPRTGGAGGSLSTSQCRNRRFVPETCLRPSGADRGRRSRQTNPQSGPETVRVIRSSSPEQAAHREAPMDRLGSLLPRVGAGDACVKTPEGVNSVLRMRSGRRYARVMSRQTNCDAPRSDQRPHSL